MKSAGISLIIIGIVALIALYITHFTMVNAVTVTPFCVLLTGVCLYVWGVKREIKY
jgi:hypothetical protein